MLLVIETKDNLVFEDVRTVNVNYNEGAIVYYRTKHYSGEAHKVNLADITQAYVKEFGETIQIYSD